MQSRQWFGRLLLSVALVLGLAAPTLPAVAVENPAASPTLSASGKEGDGWTPKQPKVQSGSVARSGDIPPVPAPECPPALMSKCSFVPAAYHQNDPADPEAYGNYDLANRPADGTRIKGVTIHDIEGTCEDAVEAFQDPLFFVSSTYVLCSDGRIIQMKLLKDIDWTAGNWWYNSHFVQIEHAGHASNPHGYTWQMLWSSIQLVQWLSQKYGFPLDKAHVHGHDNVPATRTSNINGMHVDPGPFFQWQNYLAMLGALPKLGGNLFNPSMVAITPLWPLNKQVVTGCNVSSHEPPPCVPPGGPFPTNFVYLYTQPDLNAPLITDPVTGPGSYDIENRSARAFYGSKFKVIDRQINGQGIWYRIWFGGQGAWFFSPHNAPTAMSVDGQCVTPKGATPVAVYGRPIPEKAEWDVKFAELNFTPPAGSVPSPSPLAYTIPAGQCYAVIQDNLMPDHYFSWSFGNEYPKVRLEGKTPYVWIEYNGRQAFVKKNDVTLAG